MGIHVTLLDKMQEGSDKEQMEVKQSWMELDKIEHVSLEFDQVE